MKGKGGEEGMKTGAGRVTKLFNYVPLCVPLCASVCLEDLALTNSKEYVYQVEAVDARGNRSGLSGKLAVRPSGGTEWAP